MVFDALGIHRCHAGIHAEGDQESIHDLMPLKAGGGETTSPGGEMNRFSRGLLHQAVPLQSFDGANHRHMRDAEALGKVGHSTPVVTRSDLGDRLAIVLGDLRSVIVPGALVTGG